jgi:hypothetical protein
MLCRSAVLLPFSSDPQPNETNNRKEKKEKKGKKEGRKEERKRQDEPRCVN